jgi:galactokinase
MRVRAIAPGRVNLIGDHTDYTGGLALPMAIDLATTVEGERGGDVVRLTSEQLPDEVVLSLDHPLDDASPGSWGRYVAGVVAELRPEVGLTGVVSSTIPVGSGLSSSAALEIAVALALGAPEGESTAHRCVRAEQIASGVPCGAMDQLASACGVEGHAMQISFAPDAGGWSPVPMPEGVEVVVVHSGEERTLVGSAYAERRAQCEAAQEMIGPLHAALPSEVDLLPGVLRRRARHVVSENRRVIDFARALRGGALDVAGGLMVASHRSLRDDFEVSTPALDALVERLVATDGVYGARLTGAGFGGCVVALTEPGALDEGWTVRASAGARIEVLEG